MTTFIKRITVLLFICGVSFSSCKEHKRIAEKEIVEKPAEINKTARDIIKESLEDLMADPGNKELPNLKNVSSIQAIYSQNNHQPIWTGNGKWNNIGDSLYTLIDSARYFGLFPKDYYKKELDTLRNRLIFDTAGKEDKLDAALWAKTDLFLTDAFVQISKDLRNGRILKDTTALRKDTALTDSFFNQKLYAFKNNPIAEFAD